MTAIAFGAALIPTDAPVAGASPALPLLQVGAASPTPTAHGDTDSLWRTAAPVVGR